MRFPVPMPELSPGWGSLPNHAARLASQPLLAALGPGSLPPGLWIVLVPAGLLLLWQLQRLIPGLGLLLARLRELASRLWRLLLALLAELVWVDPNRRRARQARRRRGRGATALGSWQQALLSLLWLPIDWLASLRGPGRQPPANPQSPPQPTQAGLAQRLRWVLAAHANLHLLLSFLRLLAPRLWLPGFLWRQIAAADSYTDEFPIRRMLWLSRQADVRDVLSRPETFAVVYGPRMRMVTLPLDPLPQDQHQAASGEIGNFLLGMQDTPRYWRDISNMRLVFRREDGESCRRLAEQAATAALDAALAAQRNTQAGAGPLHLNLPLDLVVPVVEALVNDYFGIPVPLRCPASGTGSAVAVGPGAAVEGTAGSPDPGGRSDPWSGPNSNGDPDWTQGDGDLLIDRDHRWLEVLFQYIFYDIKGEKSRDACRRDAPLVRHALQRAIRQRRQQMQAGIDTENEDVLSRCLRLQRSGTPGMDDESLRVNLTGFLVGAMTPLINATCQVIAVLLERPQALQRARAAAWHSDPAQLRACVLEALRFWPGDPVIWRWCSRDSWLGAGANRCAVPRGTLVMAWNSSAMFDPALLASPWEFRTDRDPGSYLHWGHGQHSCTGAYLNMAVIPGMLGPLLRQWQLQRTPGSSGRPRSDHPDGITMRQFPLQLWPASDAVA